MKFLYETLFIIVIFIPVFVFAGRALIKSFVERLVAHRFDQRIEEFRSDLRQKESRIVALQDKLLGDRAALNSHLIQKRVHAIEIIWEASVRLDKFQWTAMAFRLLNFEEIAKKPHLEENEKKFFEMMGGVDRVDEIAAIGGDTARIFVPEQVWKIFSAYRGLCIFCYMKIRVLAIGISDGKFFKDEAVVNSIKEILPHFSDYLEKYGVVGAANLIDPLRDLLLSSLRSCLMSTDVEQQDMNSIIGAIAELDRLLAEKSKDQIGKR